MSLDTEYGDVQNRAKGAASAAAAIGRAAIADNVTFLAAGIAFYAFVSLLPLLVLALVAGTMIGGQEFALQVVGALDQVLTPDSQDVVQEALLEGEGRASATVVGVLVLLWSGLKVFRGLDLAFSQVYGTVGEESFLRSLINALTVFLAIGLGVIVMVSVGTVTRLLPDVEFVVGTSFLIMFVTLSVLFYPMYYVFPSTNVTAREVVPGAVFAAFGWTVLGELFGIYAANAGTFALFGILGAVLLLVTWLYFGAIIIMVGAVVNAVFAGHRRTTEIGEQPVGVNDENATESTTEDTAEDPTEDATSNDLDDRQPVHRTPSNFGMDRSVTGSRTWRTEETGTRDQQVQQNEEPPTRTTEPMSDEGDETAARDAERTDPDPNADESATDADAGRSATDADGPAESTDADGPAESTDESAYSENATSDEGIPADERPSADERPFTEDEPTRYHVPSTDDAPSTDHEPSTERDSFERGEESFAGRTRSKSVAQVELDEVRSELAKMRDQLEAFEGEVDDRTVSRSEVESDLKRYVRRRMRRGRARGWGPYIVLLYGTAMTIGAFYYLDGGWAILAMIVLWLSTLGLYVLMVLVGAGINALMVPFGLKDRLSSWRS